MKTLIVYGTKYGCTEGCAKDLAKEVTGEVELCNLKNSKPADLEKYDKVIIGGSIVMGGIQKEVTEFCSTNLETLKGKKLGLFICCMRDGETAETQFNSAFPKELVEAATIKGYFGGEFILKKMTFIDKLIVKKVAKVSSDTSNILKENIHKFAEKMNIA
ncbi:flavodoxin domain-containing protein [Alkaliphilus serpentinus]|uniref:Flavodoxin n=1 Tax=Alkaliphilus serpentinus TaxID=1482731 RepID=A0A833MB97_9FIRM|nr:flavodoxin domain-containing protein [Alkaliphilus serpentinus]KAB3532814.1 flavodoxin [Alkaliphilus serpentinus]